MVNVATFGIIKTNNMKEELITLPTAILAKEKGFDIRCKKAYFETINHSLTRVVFFYI